MEKDLGVLMHENLDMIKQCVLAVQKANLILGCITNSVASRSSKVILLLCSALLRILLCSALLRTLLYSALLGSGEPTWTMVQLWAPQHKEDVDLLSESRGSHKDDQGPGALPLKTG